MSHGPQQIKYGVTFPAGYKSIADYRRTLHSNLYRLIAQHDHMAHLIPRYVADIAAVALAMRQHNVPNVASWENG